MSPQLPNPGTTVILRKRVGPAPFSFDFNNSPSTTVDAFAIVREENAHDIRLELKGQPFEIYLPKRLFTSRGSDLTADPPIILIPLSFNIETLPL